jgi:exonuclease VII large subunit
LGTIESGVDFEKRILAIYQECRTHDQIEAAFNSLQQELDESIKQRMADTQQLLFDHFDEDVHQRLKMQLENAQQQLDHFGKRFWHLTEYVLQDRAIFNQTQLLFDLNSPPATDIHPGRYHLISKTQPREEGEPTNPHGYFLYRLSHPLGEWSVDTAKALPVPEAELVFDITNHGARIAMVEALKGKSGYLCLEKLTVESYEKEEYLLFSAFADGGTSLDQETCEKLFSCEATNNVATLSLDGLTRLQQEATRHAQATISRSLEINNSYFSEARDRLDKWAEDMVLAAEKSLRDTKEQIKALKREARQATTLQEQKEHQEKLGGLERKQRKQRQEIFAVEDEIMAKRDALVGQLETRLSQKTGRESLFAVRWRVV